MIKKIPENLIENNFLNLIFGKKHRFNCNQIKTNNTRKKGTDATIKFLLMFFQIATIKKAVIKIVNKKKLPIACTVFCN